MRLWHIDILPYLPKSQLLAQWRELNSIFKKQDKHILINYVYRQPTELSLYTDDVIEQMQNRGYKIKSLNNYKKYFADKTIIVFNSKAKFIEHNDKYLLICFMNLYEKYIRGQKDFDKATFNKLYDFVNTKFDLKSLGINKEN